MMSSAYTDCPSRGSVVAVQSQRNVLHGRHTTLISGRCARACAHARAKTAKCSSFVFVCPQTIFSTRTAAFPIKKTNLKKVLPPLARCCGDTRRGLTLTLISADSALLVQSLRHCRNNHLPHPSLSLYLSLSLSLSLPLSLYLSLSN